MFQGISILGLWRRASVLTALCLGLLVEMPSGDARVRWSTPGSYRLWLMEMSDFALDEAGTTVGQTALGLHRLRLQPRVEVGPVNVNMELDVLTGQTFGTTTSIGAGYTLRRDTDPSNAFDGWTTVLPRQAWFSISYPWADFKLGQYATHWGLGLWDNDGSTSEGYSWLTRPASGWGGDLVDRVKVSIKPLAPFFHSELRKIELHGGGGLVFQDDRINLIDEESAWEWFGGVSYQGQGFSTGVRYTTREEERSPSQSLSRWSLDTFIHGVLPLYLANAELRAAIQVLAVGGERTHQNETTDLQAMAAVMRAEYRWHCPRVAIGFDAGWMTGDDPETASDETMVADPDFRVGFIMFQDVVRFIAYREAERIDAQGLPLDSQETVTHGSVRNVAYIQPGVTWRPGSFSIAMQLLMAWSEQLAYDRVNTLTPSTPRNSFDEMAASFYGTEASGTLRYTLDFKNYRTAGIGIDAGILLPGPAISASAGGDPITKVLWRLDLGW